MQASWGARIVRALVSVVLTAMGLVFVASMLAAAFLVLCLGALRALWGRVTGRPVTPWAFRVDPRQGWQTWEDLRRRRGGAAPFTTEDAQDARAPGSEPRALPRFARPGDISDVEPRDRS